MCAEASRREAYAAAAWRGQAIWRPAHLITPDQIDAWLADYVKQRITYHRTSIEAADSLLRTGVDIERSRVGAFGQGLYTATETDASRGPVGLAVAVRLRRPLQEAFNEAVAFIDELAMLVSGKVNPAITREVAVMVRRELLSLGYDGLIVWDAGGDGIDYVVALLGKSVRVVQ